MRIVPKRLLAVTAVLAIAAAGCAKSEDSATTESGVKLVKEGQLTVCTSLPYAPFESKEGDKIVGFDVDLIDLVAKELDVTQTIVDTSFEGIKSGQDLKVGKCDIAAAAMTILPERQEVMDFSDPYFDATQVMMTRVGKPYKSLADLKGKKIGAQAGTTGLAYVKEREAANGYTVVEYKELGSEFQALSSNQIEAMVNDLPVINDLIKKNAGQYVTAAVFDTGEKYGFAVAKGGNPELLKLINETLAKAKQDGTYDALYEKWIGSEPTS